MKFNKATKNLLSEEDMVGVRNTRILKEYISKDKIDDVKYTATNYKTKRTLGWEETKQSIFELYHDFKFENDWDDDKEFSYRDDMADETHNEVSNEFIEEILDKIRERGWNVGRGKSKKNFDY